MFFSVNMRSSRASMSSVATVRNMIGNCVTSNLKIVGGSISSGSVRRPRSKRERTSSAATSMSVPKTNSIRTEERPSLEVEVTRSTPGAADTICSIGRLMSVSISSGPTPS